MTSSPASDGHARLARGRFTAIDSGEISLTLSKLDDNVTFRFTSAELAI